MLQVRAAANNLFYRVAGRSRRELRARQLFNAAGVPAADPLATRRIVARYQKRMDTRFGQVRALTAKTFKDSVEGVGLVLAAKSTSTKLALGDADRAAAQFESWLNATMMNTLLESTPTAISPVAGAFVLQVNAQAIGVAAVQAFAKAKKAGIAVSGELAEFVANVRSATPADIVATQQFGLLRNMTFETGAELRAELQLGLRTGKSIDDIAASIDARLKSVNLVRARTIVRTEITRAHAEASLNSFQLQGVTQVEALVEFTLNVHGGADPCPQCVDLAGQIWTLDRARGIIPVHANCQCGWVPVPPARGRRVN